MSETVKIEVTGTTCKYDGNDLRNVELTVELPLRDLFAGFALAGLAGLYPQGGLSFGDTVGPMAYELADAVIAAREPVATTQT